MRAYVHEITVIVVETPAWTSKDDLTGYTNMVALEQGLKVLKYLFGLKHMIDDDDDDDDEIILLSQRL